MPKNWQKLGYLIPENIDPDENICICVPVPKDWGHIRAFLGQLTELSKWLTWEKTGDDKAAQAARRWFEITQCVMKEIDCAMSNCGCGGNDKGTPTNQRYTEEGLLEVSYDGGITWEDGDAIDPRFNSPIWTPIPGDDGEDKRCAAANSIITALKDEQSKSSTILGAAGGVAGLLVSIASFVIGSGVGLVAGLILALIGGVLTLIVAGGQTVFDTSFDEEFWAEVLCILFCNMEDDASFSKGQWMNVIAEIKSLAPYPANDWTQAMIKSVGMVGLTNLARAQRAGLLPCDTCDCANGCPEKYQIYDENPVNGTIVEVGDNYLIVEAPASGVATIQAIDPDECCYVSAYEVLSGVATPSAWRACGNEDPPPWDDTTPVGQCANVVEIQWSSGFPGGQIKLYFEPCP